MNSIAERRFLCELRAEGDGRRLTGVALRYGSEAVIFGERETFVAGALGDVARADILLNLQHNRSRPIARTLGGGLTLTDTAEELRAEVVLPVGLPDADAALAGVRAGIYRGLSVEFIASRDRYDGGLRTIESAELVGLGLVDKPAYSDSEVKARSLRRFTGGRPDWRLRGLL